MANDIIKIEYSDISIHFTEDGWFDATEAAERYGKRVDHWLKTEETKSYITAMMEFLNTPKKGDLIKTKRGRYGGGTWLHPRLAVAFARWLEPRFGVWCDIQIENILRQKHPHFDWKKLRHQASSSYKVMNAILEMKRQESGKETKFFHYANEAKLINWAMTGEFKPMDREGLTHDELDLLARLEERNSILIGIGMERDIRKLALQQLVDISIRKIA